MTGYQFYTTETYKVDDEKVRKITDVYKGLKRGPIDINSKEGQKLSQEGTKNVPVNEFYKWWMWNCQNK